MGGDSDSMRGVRDMVHPRGFYECRSGNRAREENQGE
jgi:hypothetical protein